jgi:SAM-dependent methyltransferase
MPGRANSSSGRELKMNEEPGEDRAPSAKIAEDWYARSFDALYPLIYAHRSVDAAAPESRFAADQLGLRHGARVLDLACGNGRHMVHLQDRGARVVGLDYSAYLLRQARRLLEPPARLVRADMRAIPFRASFDAVVNFFTSFGYFVERRENLAVAQGVARALRTGGRFFIDYIGSRYAETHLVPVSARIAGEYAIEERRWIDPNSRRVNKITALRRHGEEVQRFEESVQLYHPDEFLALLHEAGLRVEQLFGDYAGTPWDEARPRMIATGVKVS